MLPQQLAAEGFLAHWCHSRNSSWKIPNMLSGLWTSSVDSPLLKSLQIIAWAVLKFRYPHLQTYFSAFFPLFLQCFFHFSFPSMKHLNLSTEEFQSFTLNHFPFFWQSLNIMRKSEIISNLHTCRWNSCCKTHLPFPSTIPFWCGINHPQGC